MGQVLGFSHCREYCKRVFLCVCVCLGAATARFYPSVIRPVFPLHARRPHPAWNKHMAVGSGAALLVPLQLPPPAFDCHVNGRIPSKFQFYYPP